MRRAAPLLLALLLGAGAFAQFAGPIPIPVRGDASAIAHYTGYMQMRATERGMPLNATAIAFDRNRTLWLALDDGLLRCDGDRHTLYQHARKDSTSLPSNAVTDVREGVDGSIWVGTQSGMARLDPSTGRFKRFRLEHDSLNEVLANRCWQVVPLRDGGAITLTEAGVFRLDPDGRFTPTRAHPDYARSGESDKVLLSVSTHDAALVPTKGGIFRIASDGSASPLMPSEAYPGGRPGDIVGLTWTSDSTLAWLDDEARLFHEFNPRTSAWRSWKADELLSERESLRELWKGPRGEWWVLSWSDRLCVAHADGSFACELFPDGSTALGTPGTLVPRQLRAEDEGRLWIASSHGALALLPADPRVSRIVPNGLQADNTILSVHEEADGPMVVGTYRGGLFISDSAGGAWKPLFQPNPKRGAKHVEGENTVTDLEPLGDGRYLVATYHGLHEADTRTMRMLHRDDIEAAHTLLSRTQVMDIVPDTAGWWWAATWQRGLFRFHPETRRCVQYLRDAGNSNSLPIDRLLCLLIDRERNLWIGCNDGGGLVRYRRGTDDFERIGLQPGDAHGEAMGVVRALEQDAEGGIWVGTHKGGIARYDPASGKTEVFDRERGVPGDLIHSIAAHPKLGVWIGGPGGIARWNAKERVFQGVDLGLRWSSDLSGIVVGADGASLLVLNGKEIVRVNTAAEATRRPPLLPRITGVVVNGSPRAAAEQMHLRAKSDRLSLEFALNDAIRAQRARVAWRLTGLNDEWNDCLGCRSAAFNELPAGHFRFEVKVLGEDGVWSEAVTLARFDAVPPWWATWWFRLIAIAALALFGYFAFRAYVERRLRAQRAAFEREQAVLRERERIASDMHDDLGAGLSGLKLRSEMALRVEKDPAKREHLASMAASAGEIIASMRQMIWAMDSGQGSVHDLIAYATSYARTYCSAHGLAIEVQVADGIPDAPLSSQQRRNLFLVMKEALHNCVKHAHAQRITLAIGWEQGLRLRLADDGIGLPKAADSGAGNGMRNMRKRMHELNGSFETLDGPGTTIALHLPL